MWFGLVTIFWAIFASEIYALGLHYGGDEGFFDDETPSDRLVYKRTGTGKYTKRGGVLREKMGLGESISAKLEKKENKV